MLQELNSKINIEWITTMTYLQVSTSQKMHTDGIVVNNINKDSARARLMMESMTTMIASSHKHSPHVMPLDLWFKLFNQSVLIRKNMI